MDEGKETVMIAAKDNLSRTARRRIRRQVTHLVAKRLSRHGVRNADDVAHETCGHIPRRPVNKEKEARRDPFADLGHLMLCEGCSKWRPDRKRVCSSLAMWYLRNSTKRI
eukprot:Selendium_serpulae@DN6053_c0_g2_i3.p1